jgi:conjugative relaxase-like TrwC/TraI family protein
MLLMQARSISGLGYYFDSSYVERLATSAVGRGEHYGGEGAARLGLSRVPPGRREFTALLSGKDPRSSEVLDSGHARVRHAFFDVVFTSPKSVSLLYALSEPEVRAAVLVAHERARDAALGYVERRAAWVKRPGADRRSEPADGLCWRAFVHHTSRSGDPHLHSHVLVANLVPSQARGWSALDSGPLYAERRTAEALYDTALRFELRESLGVDFRARTGRGSDVAGFSDQMIDAFSQRATAIRAAGLSSASRTPNQSSHLRELRPDKVAEPSIDELVEAWTSRAREVGIIPGRDVPGVFGGSRRSEPSERVVVAVDSAVRDAIAGFGSSFSRSELIVASARAFGAGARVAVFESRIDDALERIADAGGAAGHAQTRRPRFDQRGVRRYASEHVRSAMVAERHYRSTSMQLSKLGTDVAMRDAIVQRRGVVTAETAHDPLASYDAIRRFREVAFDVFARERILAPSQRALARFEAATGAVGGGGGIAGREERAARLTVLVDADRFDVARRARLVADGLANGGAVLFCESGGSYRGRHELKATPRTASEPDPRLRCYREGSQAIVFTPDFSSAIAELESLRLRAGAGAVVIADERFAPLIGGGVAASRRRSRAAGESRGPVLVLGDAWSVRWPSLASERTYVMAAPIARDLAEERALAYALMTGAPRSGRGVTNSLLPAERLARGWGIVTDIDRGASTLASRVDLGEQRGKERGLERAHERDRAHLGPE